jgi:hypothetical protein
VPKGIRVRIRANADLFTGPGGAPEAIFGPLAHGRAFSTGWGEGRAAAGFVPDAEGRVDLAGIRPDVRVDISVIDVRTGVVVAETSASAGAGETEEVTLRLRQGARELTVRVVNPSGEPLDWAWVRLGPTVSMRTDDDGRVRFTGLRADRFRLEVRRDGYVPLVRPEFELPHEPEVTIALEPGRTVRLAVTDPGGRPVPVTEFGITGRDMGSGWWVPEESPGRHLLQNLPAGRVTIFAEVAGRRFALEHDTAVAEASLRVPRLGVVRVRVARLGAERRLRLIPRDASGAAQEVEVDPPDVEGDQPVEFPAVLPGRYRVALLPPDGDVPEVSAELRVVAGETVEANLRD